jgi:hypothetical protein
VTVDSTGEIENTMCSCNPDGSDCSNVCSHGKHQWACDDCKYKDGDWSDLD